VKNRNGICETIPI